MSDKIHIFLKEDEKRQYYQNQLYQMEKQIQQLDPSWIHSKIIQNYLEDAINELMVDMDINNIQSDNNPVHERRIEKYTTWIEVIRLIHYQYGRYSNEHCSYTEGLYSALSDLACRYFKREDKFEIAVLGCGPGRTVLDMAQIYPDNRIWGLDYSYFSLFIAKRLLLTLNSTYSFPIRDVSSGNKVSSLFTMKSFGLKNIELGLLDIMQPHSYKYSMIICSNTINLLPNHHKALENVISMLEDDGIIIYADLVGWRLDRPIYQRVLNSMESIVKGFEDMGLQALEYYKGGPYVEKESDSMTEYMEYFFVGKRGRH